MLDGPSPADSDLVSPARPGEVTRLLAQLGTADDPEIYERLMPLIYAELRGLASGFLRQERPDHTLQPTALVHEAYLRLAAQQGGGWESKGHFLAIAATAMRRILVDHARARDRLKRGGDLRRTGFRADELVADAAGPDLVALDDAMRTLARVDPRKVRIVELRYFAGLSIEDTATAMRLSPATVKREWRLARAWLHAELGGDD